ncbi:hypothetical protein AB7942_29310, partial [Neobacillus sp. BF23-41]|uniref:hypothetical protein n=1 Tax=Neobacillus sp. BF23-41 TaxID=3240280 RepID=UPI0034E4C210
LIIALLFFLRLSRVFLSIVIFLILKKLIFMVVEERNRPPYGDLKHPLVEDHELLNCSFFYLSKWQDSPMWNVRTHKTLIMTQTRRNDRVI